MVTTAVYAMGSQHYLIQAGLENLFHNAHTQAMELISIKKD